MKYIKKFENITDEPQIGDYVLIKIHLIEYKKKNEVNAFINNTIGVIIYISDIDIRVQYDNIPDNIKDWFLESKRLNKITYSRILRKESIVDLLGRL